LGHQVWIIDLPDPAALADFLISRSPVTKKTYFPGLVLKTVDSFPKKLAIAGQIVVYSIKS